MRLPIGLEDDMTEAGKRIILIVDPEHEFIDWAGEHLAARSVEISGVTSGEEGLPFMSKR